MSDSARNGSRTRHARRSRWLTAAVVLASAGLVMSACSSGQSGGSASGSSSSGSSSSGSSPSAGQNSASSPGQSSTSQPPPSSATATPVTLVVQDGESGNENRQAAYTELNKQFEAAHPGVTIKYELKNFTDLVNTLKLQLTGNTPPDITQVNEGYGSLGQLVSDNLLKSLDDYAAQYKWTDRQPAGLLAADGKFSADGKQMGTGNLWAMSATGGWVGLWMNTKIAASLGIDAAPTTFAELEADLAKAQAKGIVAFQFGASDGGQSAWLLTTLLAAENSPQLVVDIVNAKKGITLDSPEALKAANTIKKWADAGYFTKGWAAYTNSDVFSKFVGGEGLFTLRSALGLDSSVAGSDTDQYTIVQFPSTAAGSTATIATGGLAWAIPAKSQHPDLAAQYLDFITSPDAAKVWIANGQIPASPPADLQSVLSSGTLNKTSQDAQSGWVDILQHGTPLPYLDWSTPTFYDTIKSSVAELAGDQISPEEFTKKLQADYGPFAAAHQ